ncbi:MAG: hypothetical protein AcusKO_04440 [Acuticoccus sp.]
MLDLGWVWAALGLAIGGVLKGATGAGAPIVAVPVLALFYNVPLAIATLLFPSLFSNAWQMWRYRAASLSRRRFLSVFALAAICGAVVGSVLLVLLEPDYLLLGVSSIVYLYIVFRIAHPQWALPPRVANMLVVPVGFVGGVLQGAAGISAPVSITFLTSMRMTREEFIVSISTFFFAMTVVQIPVLAGLGVLTWERTGLSLLACLPLFGAMPLGAFLARHLSREVFDKVMLGVLAIMATRLVLEALLALIAAP